MPAGALARLSGRPAGPTEEVAVHLDRGRDVAGLEVGETGLDVRVQARQGPL
jgi:hypothetical protein